MQQHGGGNHGHICHREVNCWAVVKGAGVLKKARKGKGMVAAPGCVGLDFSDIGRGGSDGG